MVTPQETRHSFKVLRELVGKLNKNNQVIQWRIHQTLNSGVRNNIQFGENIGNVSQLLFIPDFEYYFLNFNGTTVYFIFLKYTILRNC